MFIIGVIANSSQSKKIKKEIYDELKAEVIWINSKSIENIRNIKFEIIIMQELPEKIKENKDGLKTILKNSKYLLLNTDLVLDSEIFESTNAKIITYGLKLKATITISSIEEKQAIISIQRAFENLQGKIIDRQEIPIELKERGSNYIYISLIKIAIINICSGKRA